jgi:hypothetical protein
MRLIRMSVGIKGRWCWDSNGDIKQTTAYLAALQNYGSLFTYPREGCIQAPAGGSHRCIVPSLHSEFTLALCYIARHLENLFQHLPSQLYLADDNTHTNMPKLSAPRSRRACLSYSSSRNEI